MRVPLGWLREYVELPAGEPGRAVADRLLRAGLEVETVDQVGSDVTGPLTVGRVVSFDQFEASNGKTIRYCQVDVGETSPRGIVCGAQNFAAGDHVVVALPGAALPGGFEIGARQTYGHVSDGMICSARELGLGDDHTGILVLPQGTEVGVEASGVLHLRDDVLDIAVTPDRGYCLSVRGVGREAAVAYAAGFRDPAALEAPPDDGAGHPVLVDDPAGCDRFVARTVRGVGVAAQSPLWMQARLRMSGMRPISLVVDVTNYVMLETGQPLHAYDAGRLLGPIGVRRARPGERLQTLDGVVRELDPEDLLITDDSGPIGIAGVMGGAATEIGPETSEVVLEAAHFDAVTIARSARRHRLPSEASRRFERGVDPEMTAAAAQRAVDLLVRLAGATATDGVTEVRAERRAVTIPIAEDYPARVAGVGYPVGTTVRRLEQVGCVVSGDGEALLVTPPAWRPDLTDPADLAEEVIRLEGYDALPSVLPDAPAGRGLTSAQRLRRRVGRSLADAGYVEVLSYPFVSEEELDQLGLPSDDPRRRALRLANPLADTEPLLRTTLLPGLLGALRRNVGRGVAAAEGSAGLALFETGLVYRPGADAPSAPRLPVDRRPAEEEVAALERALPDQPRHVAAVLSGDIEAPGWWGPGRSATWSDAVDAARLVCAAAGVVPRVVADDDAPWHPGRCAAVYAGEVLLGHAGELHPRAVADAELPARSCAMELDLDRLHAVAVEITPAPRISTYPVATQDVALVVDAAVAAADVEAALREGAGPLLETVRLFDVYAGAQVGEGRRSLAYALRFRAPDRTLTAEEVAAARDAAVSEAGRRTGAELRG
jgi:phenylalanyl-tRNA synthetase beta chain